MGDIFKPTQASESAVLSSVENGRMTITTDTYSLYVDISGTHVKITDVLTGTYSNISGKVAPLFNKIYLATDQDKLVYYTFSNNTVSEHTLGGASQSEVVTDSNSTVSIELNNNTIYNLTNANISNITLTASNTLDYCTICFTASTPTIFSPPIGSRCIGHDCSGGIFTPVSGKEYQIAVDKLGSQLTFYVLRMDLNAAS